MPTQSLLINHKVVRVYFQPISINHKVNAFQRVLKRTSNLINIVQLNESVVVEDSSYHIDCYILRKDYHRTSWVNHSLIPDSILVISFILVSKSNTLGLDPPEAAWFVLWDGEPHWFLREKGVVSKPNIHVRLLIWQEQSKCFENTVSWEPKYTVKHWMKSGLGVYFKKIPRWVYCLSKFIQWNGVGSNYTVKQGSSVNSFKFGLIYSIISHRSAWIIFSGQAGLALRGWYA